MDEILQQLGLNAKEAKLYLFLVRGGAKTASQISKDLSENRTNTYMILDSLTKQELVELKDNTAVRNYQAADPTKLKDLVLAKQQQIRRAHSSLNSILPELSSIHSLGQHRPGVVYLEGIDGYKQSLNDMARSGERVDIIASSVGNQNNDAVRALESYAYGRKSKVPHSRIIFSDDDRKDINVALFQSKGYDVRFWTIKSHEGEFAVYGDKVAMSVYQPSLVVTVITNEVLAQTFKNIFDHLWSSAKK